MCVLLYISSPVAKFLNTPLHKVVIISIYLVMGFIIIQAPDIYIAVDHKMAPWNSPISLCEIYYRLQWYSNRWSIIPGDHFSCVVTDTGGRVVFNFFDRVPEGGAHLNHTFNKFFY